MILVDSSVWIAFFNGQMTAQTLYLRDRADRERIVVGDLILCEVLQGFRSDRDFHSAQELLHSFRYCDMVGYGIALQSARHYRHLRQQGITVRKTIDVLIATFCIANDLQLLHADRDFDALETHLRLRVLHPD